MKKTKDKAKKPEATKTETTTRGEIYDWMQSLVFALIICILVFVFLFRIVDVSGDSMNPTLTNGDKLVVSDVFYKPKQGDIVIFRKDEYKPEALVKRVIATEGQTVEIDFDRGRVYVDGELLDEPYIAEPTRNQLDFKGAQTVPEGCVFVMGDNRNHSEDSRFSDVGCVKKEAVLGKVLLVIFPGRQTNELGAVTGGRDWHRFGAVS
mgnify:CR=1 FL=1